MASDNLTQLFASMPFDRANATLSELHSPWGLAVPGHDRARLPAARCVGARHRGPRRGARRDRLGAAVRLGPPRGRSAALTCAAGSPKMRPNRKENEVMGRGDRRMSPKKRRKIGQRAKKARIKRQIVAKKAAKAPAAKKK